MKRWTIKEMAETSDLKFAACILNERRECLNPYTPLAQKLEKAKNLLLRMDSYLGGWSSGTDLPADKTVEILYRDGYHSAARLIEDLTADLGNASRERELLNGCFGYLTELMSREELAKTLRDRIGLTDDEIRQYQMGWVMEEDEDGEAKI